MTLTTAGWWWWCCAGCASADGDATPRPAFVCHLVPNPIPSRRRSIRAQSKVAEPQQCVPTLILVWSYTPHPPSRKRRRRRKIRKKYKEKGRHKKNEIHFLSLLQRWLDVPIQKRKHESMHWYVQRVNKSRLAWFSVLKKVMTKPSRGYKTTSKCGIPAISWVVFHKMNVPTISRLVTPSQPSKTNG